MNQTPSEIATASVALLIGFSSTLAAVGDKILISATKTGDTTVDATWTEEDCYGTFYSRAVVDCRNRSYAYIVKEAKTADEAAMAKAPLIMMQNDAELTGYGDLVNAACVKSLGK
jgi:hypothetical protein